MQVHHLETVLYNTTPCDERLDTSRIKLYCIVPMGCEEGADCVREAIVSSSN